ncbi:hypothetical protein GALL_238480 [mine drainage metagenome]|uniref:Uncharacterized protein n=1 Tax=mine drainage metagenome TaxID=410659 RepID=A0A1J5RXL9_9ZZZZ
MKTTIVRGLLLAALLLAGGIGAALRFGFAATLPGAQQASPDSAVARHEQVNADLREMMILHKLML